MRLGCWERGRVITSNLGLLRLQSGSQLIKLKRLLNTPLILFLITIGTTFWAGYQMSTPLAKTGLLASPLEGAVTFCIGILLVLGAHEMGHYVMAKRRGIETTPPYFIPVPIFLGTMGAVIRMKSIPSNRDALFDIGSAGPMLGFLVLIPVTILGISWSFALPPGVIPSDAAVLPDPLLFQFLSGLVGISPDTELLLHPLALAGWVGMVVTMLNLMPVGSLDGGHVVRTLFGPKYHRWISFGGAIITMLIGYWLMAILMFLFALRGHPGPMNDLVPLSPGRKLFSIVLLAILVVSVAPMNLF